MTIDTQTLTPEQLIVAEQAHEEAVLEYGFNRFHEAQNELEVREGYDARASVSSLIKGAVPIVSAGIARWVEEAQSARGRKPEALPIIAALDADVAALIALRETFRSLPGGGCVNDLTDKIGTSVKIECEAELITAKDEKAAEKFKRLAAANVRPDLLAMKHEELLGNLKIDLGWDRRAVTLVGKDLLQVVLRELADVFEQSTIMEDDSRKSVVRLTEAGAEALAGMDEAAAWLNPSLQPMIAVPKPWTSFYTGAYYNPRLAKLVPLVRTRSKEHKQLIEAAIKDGSAKETMDAVNLMQSTRLATDMESVRIIRWALANGKRPSQKFPTATLPDTPEKIDKKEWKAMPPERREALTRRRKAVKNVRQALATEVQSLRADLETAEFLADYPAFYLPHNLDFRARTYAVPHFNHQRSDHIKSLFLLADGVQMGGHGGKWLMIHLANTGDFWRVCKGVSVKISKADFEDRIAWVQENEARIIEAAKDPQGSYEFWAEAGSPFCFLQACREYAAWAATGFSEDFESRIAVAADGSCSGLQHYSVITRSREEAHHVNLVPRDTVGDVYKVVAEQAVPAMETAAHGGSEVARLVLANGFGRDESKRNVMTYFYGSEQFGMRQQHMKDVMDPLRDRVALGEVAKHPYEVMVKRTNKETGETKIMPDAGWSAAGLMAKTIHHAVTTVAPKADEAAKWIQGVAGALAHEGHSMIWKTPTGFPVVHRYVEYNMKTVNVWLHNRSAKLPTGTDKVDTSGNVLSRIQLHIRESPTSRIKKTTMRSASAPNLIHSCDGAHLQRSVVMANRKHGIEHFLMIHDSFGTHAGHMEAFNQTIREALVSCYENYCPLEELDRYSRSVLSEKGQKKLAPLPAKGNLDLSEILEAQFAFA